jgi:transposase InsO family protein
MLAGRHHLAERRATANMGAMPVDDRDIYRSAHLWISRHGENATAKAREMVEAMRAKGDNAGAEVWSRIIVAIVELGAPPTDARH